MIQSELANSAKPKESFYFLLLIDLIVLAGNKSTEENRQFKFSLFKGLQIFNHTKQLIQLTFHREEPTKVQKVELTFFLKDHNPNRKNDFVLKLREFSEDEQNEVGNFSILANKYINNRREKRDSNIVQTVQVGDFRISYVVFIENDRAGLDRIVKKFKESKSQNTKNIEIEENSEKLISTEEKSQTISENNQKVIVKDQQQVKAFKISASVRKLPEPASPKVIKNSLQNNPIIKFAQQQKERQANPLNIRIILFIILSVVAIWHAMSPTRKVRYKSDK